MKLVLRIMGGLGNQLFQYAFMRYLNLKYPGSSMYIDYRGYKKYKIRDFELKSFKLYDQINDYDHESVYYLLSRQIYHVYQYLYLRITKTFAPMLGSRFSRNGLIFSTIDYHIPLKISQGNNYIYGYFGRVDHILEIQDILRNEIQLKAPFSDTSNMYSQMIQNSLNSVGVSIRYGSDYKRLGWPICRPAYYRSAMDRLLKMRGKCKFFIFSDALNEIIDENWFDGYDVVYVDGCPVVESFILLRSCSDFIISNSSFSWWASWLAINPNRIVYTPNFFYSERFNGAYDRLIHFDRQRFLDYKTGNDLN